MLNSEIIREFTIYSNRENKLSEGYTKLFNNREKNKEISFQFPEDIGSGSTSKIILNTNLQIYNNNIKCKKDIEIGGMTRGDAYVLAVCTGENIEWIEHNSGKYFELKKGEAMFYRIKDIVEFCEYKKEHYYGGVTILIKPEEFKNYLSPSYLDKNIFKKDYKNIKINKFMLPPEGIVVTEQISNCTYKDTIKSMYLEGKALELLSISLNNIIEKDISNINNIKFSKTEIESIYKAKEILDNNINNHITISQLSKLICLNQFKLKTGFKEIFGKPVYTYQLDRRMELARKLLQIYNIDVKQVADRIGYANSSSFSKAFRKKYGISPSNYVDYIK